MKRIIMLIAAVGVCTRSSGMRGFGNNDTTGRQHASGYYASGGYYYAT